jgi:hypothetical protein
MKIILILLICTINVAQSIDAPDEFTDIRIGRQGVPQVIINAGSYTCGGVELPLELSFDPTIQSSSILPHGWSLRLLDLNSFLTSETEGVVRLPSGENVPVNLGAAAESSDSQIQAPVSSIDGDQLLVQYRGLKYFYKKGVIRKVESPSATTHFKYDGDKLRSIESSNGQVVEVLQTEQGADRIIKVIQKKPGTPDAILEFSFLKALAESSNTYVNESLEEKIVFIKLNDRKYTVTESNESGNSHMQIDREHLPGSSGLNAAQLASIKWDGQSKRVQSFNDKAFRFFDLSNVECEKVRSNSQYYSPCVETKSDGQGSWTVLHEGFCQPVQCKQFNFTPDKLTEKTYVQTPLGDQLRKETLNGEEVYHAWYSTTGVLMRDKRGSLTRTFKDGKVSLFKDGIFLRQY